MAWGREAAGGVRVFVVAADAAPAVSVAEASRVLTVERCQGAAPSLPLPDPAEASTVRPVALAPVASVELQATSVRAHGEVVQARAFDDGDDPVPTPRVVRTPRSLPMTRGECEDGIRPCPYVSCRHHLLWISDDPAKELDEFYERVVVGDNGEGLLRALAALPDTCVLDVADRGEHTYDDVSVHFGLTRARAQQIATEATLRVRYSAEKRKLLEGLEDGGCHPEDPGNVWG